MRGIWAVVCVGLALLVAACDPTRDARYLREGIGTDLYWDGLANATELQDAYLSNICAQAISPSARSADAESCGFLSLAPREWGLLVQAGMNDIDLRCDSYLAWLHDKRASREPFLKQLAAMGGATAAILKATDQSALSIALAGIAFGLAADTFTNIDLRLLNGVDYTTVQSIVRGNRAEFRQSNLSVVVDNRPAAIYIMRSYLSLCMPSAIELSINNTLTVFHRAGPEALARSTPLLQRTPVATSRTSAAVSVRSAAVTNAGTPMSAPQRAPVIIDGVRVGTFEQKLLASTIRDFQRVVCLSPDGKFTETTRAAVLAWLATNKLKDANFPDRISARDANRLRDALDDGPKC
jgi:hypothetical protein